MAKDMMQAFELYQPDTLDNALSLADRYGDGGWIMSGGNDSLDWFKDRVKRPVAVIELAGVTDLEGIKEVDGGLEIGAQTTLDDIANSNVVRENFAVLAQAASKVASPQIRNVSSIGGNVCQDTRCWYSRDGLDCYRAGGTKCYADTPQGMNREHCLFGADRCVAVSQSDTAPALVVLDATFVIAGPSGSRTVAAADFFIGPDIDITRMTVLEP
ncbi:MAG: FAD binding domain-containing protein, partial [Pseudomonadota bacterium]|nr:FAD binding domain-containing protein [Pseudomonadota bacterium]